jgi:endoglucanase
VSWQFLINTTTPPSGNSSGTLDPTNFGQYDQLVQACLVTGASCIIDIHNYARFENKIIGQGGPSDADFANLWSQIATKVLISLRTVINSDMPSTKMKQKSSLVS